MRSSRAYGFTSLLVSVSLAAACVAGPFDAARERPPLTLSARIDSLLAAHLANAPAASAAVAVVRGQDTLLLRGYGLADREANRSAGPATVYELGSITKQFTAAAIMRLVEQGKVGLEDDLSKYVPAFPLQGLHVTVRQLLDHTSGIPSYTSDPAYQAEAALDLPPDSIIGFVAGEPFNFEPGSSFRYNNTGYVLLGMIIEKVSGRSYATYLDEQFFQPLGLRRTRYCPPASARDTSYARGYSAPAPLRRLQPAYIISMSGPYSAGALCSSVRDFIVWQRALHGGRVVDARSYELMTTRGTLSSGQSTDYGFGLFVGTLGPYRMIQHSGGITGFSTMQAYLPDESLSVVVFTNADAASPEQLGFNIARAVLGLPLQ